MLNWRMAHKFNFLSGNCGQYILIRGNLSPFLITIGQLPSLEIFGSGGKVYFEWNIYKFVIVIFIYLGFKIL